MSRRTVAIAADHAGFELKTALVNDLNKAGYSVLDLGTNSTVSVDYPEFADRLARTLESCAAPRGVLVCGSGIGISIAANRHSQIRAALCRDENDAEMARRHNNANVIVLSGGKMSLDAARTCLRVFMETEFEGGRHARRIAKMS